MRGALLGITAFLACGCGFDLGQLQSDVDAGIDSGIDAGRDAGRDAAMDGPEDAGLDAALPDAGADAEPPDAFDSGFTCDAADCEDGDPCTMNFCGPSGCAMLPAPDGTRCGSGDPMRDPPSACCGGTCTTLDSPTNCGGCGVGCDFGQCLMTITTAGLIVRCRCNMADQCPEDGVGWQCLLSACECLNSMACADGADCVSQPPYEYCAYP